VGLNIKKESGVTQYKLYIYISLAADVKLGKLPRGGVLPAPRAAERGCAAPGGVNPGGG